MKKSTEELLNELKSSNAVKGFLNENSLELCDMTLKDYLEQLLISKGLIKAEVIAKQAEYKVAKEEYTALKDSKDGEKAAIEKELVAASKGIDSEKLLQYKTKRKEKIFPVYAQLFSGRCSCCSMEPPLAAQNKLLGGATIECDNCHRILYNE